MEGWWWGAIFSNICNDVIVDSLYSTQTKAHKVLMSFWNLTVDNLAVEFAMAAKGLQICSQIEQNVGTKFIDIIGIVNPVKILYPLIIISRECGVFKNCCTLDPLVHIHTYVCICMHVCTCPVRYTYLLTVVTFSIEKGCSQLTPVSPFLNQTFESDYPRLVLLFVRLLERLEQQMKGGGHWKEGEDKQKK